jgi:hypothetical protein
VREVASVHLPDRPAGYILGNREAAGADIKGTSSDELAKRIPSSRDFRIGAPAGVSGRAARIRCQDSRIDLTRAQALASITDCLTAANFERFPRRRGL